MAVIRYLDSNGGPAVVDLYPDNRRFTYFDDERFEEFIIVVNPDNTSSVVGPGDPDYDLQITTDMTGDIQEVRTFSAQQKRDWGLVVWYEIFIRPNILTIYQATSGDNRNNRIRSLTAALGAWYIDLATAQTLATNLVDNTVEPTFDQLGRTTPPAAFRELAGLSG